MRIHAAALIALLVASCSSEERRPNVLLISIDTLRPDHLGSYGYERNTSPRIDQLAREGVLFENHISSSSWTLPAHAALFTGMADSVHGCVSATETSLAPGFDTLAERFQSAGWATGGFFSGPYLHPAFGLGQGFDAYTDCMSYAQTIEGREREEWAMSEDVMRASHRDVTNPAVYKATHDWIEGAKDRPFFAFVHLWDVHFDFIPPAPYDTLFDPDYEGDITGDNFFFDERINSDLPERDKQHLEALYDGEIRWTDDHVGKLLDDLDAWGLAENTIVVVTSDHGTEFFEHGGKAHRTTLYDELIRIPLIMRYPDHLPAGSAISEQTRLIDVGPTLCELAGIGSGNVMGSSLVQLARTGEADFDRVAVSELFSVGKQLRSSRTPEDKFIDDIGRNTYYWFDLENDAAELAPSQDAEAGRGAAAMARYLQSLEVLEQFAKDSPNANKPELPEDVASQIEGFGYTGSEDD